MKVDKLGIDLEQWKGVSFEVFKKALQGKLRSDKIKELFDKVPKSPKIKKVTEDK